MSFGAVLLTTAILIAVDNGAELEHLEIAYLFPTALIAVCYGSNFAFLTSCASAMTTAYFLLPPKFSLHIANPLHIAELGFFVLLSVIAGKIVSLLAHDAPESLLEAWRRNRGRRETSRKTDRECIGREHAACGCRRVSTMFALVYGAQSNEFEQL